MFLAVFAKKVNKVACTFAAEIYSNILNIYVMYKLYKLIRVTSLIIPFRIGYI